MKKLILFSALITLIGCTSTASPTPSETTAATTTAAPLKKVLSNDGAFSIHVNEGWIENSIENNTNDFEINIEHLQKQSRLGIKAMPKDSVPFLTLSSLANTLFTELFTQWESDEQNLTITETTIAGKNALMSTFSVVEDGRPTLVFDVYLIEFEKTFYLSMFMYVKDTVSIEHKEEALNIMNSLSIE